MVLLDGITDPHNLGAILRSADQFGADLVVIPERRAVQANETVVKVSSGAAQYVPLAVVPNLTLSIQKNVKRLFNKEALLVTHDVSTGLVRSSIPGELGSDLLCNLAYAHYLKPDDTVMTVDFGTALTFSTVSRDGQVLGVAIVPGLLTSVHALFGATAQLPQVDLRIPSSALGRSSEDSIRAGIMYGYAGLVNSIIEKTEEETGEKLFIIATGGLSKTISPLIPRIDMLDKLHTLNGLRLIASLNF